LITCSVVKLVVDLVVCSKVDQVFTTFERAELAVLPVRIQTRNGLQFNA